MNNILLFVLGIICFIDVKTKEIPDSITIAGMITGLIYNHFALNSILGIVVSIGIVHCLNTARVFKTCGGDAKLLGFIGAFLGWQAVLVILWGSIILAIPFKVYRIIKYRHGAYAYSPFIGLATLILFYYAR